MNETNHPAPVTCTLIQDLLGVTDGGIYEAVVSLKQRLDAVVADNSRLLPKAASELSNAWMLNKYWVGINAALMHLEMGRVDVAREWLGNTIAGPGLDSPDLEEVDDIDAWAEHQNRGSISHAQALEIIKADCPATAAALEKQQAIGVEKFSDMLGKMYQHEKPASVRARTIKHVVFLATHFAAALRNGEAV
ncbi:hypothetical protein [Serratia fonticola]